MPYQARGHKAHVDFYPGTVTSTAIRGQTRGACVATQGHKHCWAQLAEAGLGLSEPPPPPRGSRPSGSPSTGPGPRLTCLGLWLGQLLLCGRDGFCSFARHFCVDKGEKKPHRTCGRPEKDPEGRLQTPATGLTQWYRIPGAQTSTGTEGRPAAASAGKDSADPAGSRRSGSHAAPRLGAAAAYAAQPPPPGPATASARRAEPSPRGRPGIALLGASPTPPTAPTAPPPSSRAPSRPGRAPDPTRSRMEADGSGDTHCTGSGAQDGGRKRPSGGRRDFRKENYFRWEGAAHFRPPPPPRRLRSCVPGRVRTFRDTRTGAVPRNGNCATLRSAALSPGSPHPHCPPAQAHGHGAEQRPLMDFGYKKYKKHKNKVRRQPTWGGSASLPHSSSDVNQRPPKARGCRGSELSLQVWEGAEMGF